MARFEVFCRRPCKFNTLSRSLFKRPLAIILTIITLILSITPFVIPPFGKFIGDAHVGDSIGFSGVVLTIGGFGLTLWQLFETQTASRAATSAVENLKIRFATVEDAALCRECISRANELERHQVVSISQPSYNSFVVLPEVYRGLRLDLITLRRRRTESLTREDKTIIQETLSKLEDTEKTVLRYIQKPQSAPPNLRPLQTAVRALSGALANLSIELQQSALGGINDK